MKIPKIKQCQVAFYDTKNNNCFDEGYYLPNEIEDIISWYGTNVYDSFKTRSFIHFDNGDIYELKLEKIDKNT